jgi:hypothetical protein
MDELQEVIVLTPILTLFYTILAMSTVVKTAADCSTDFNIELVRSTSNLQSANADRRRLKR